MARRSPARFMAPLALLAAVAAVWIVVNSTTKEDAAKSAGGETTATNERTQTSATTQAGTQRKRYTVKSGDTLGTIAEKTGVPIEELQELNPDLDPQSLRVGQRIRIRQ